MSGNFDDFQLGVYADAVKRVNSWYPYGFRSVERKAAEALPDWLAGHGPGHAFQAPELFTADTPLGSSCYREWK